MAEEITHSLPWWEDTDPVGRQIEFGRVAYRPIVFRGRSKKQYSRVQIVGLDTEANAEGRTFLVCTPDYEIHGSELPHSLFALYPQDTTFVTFNLGYEAGAMLYWVPEKQLNILRVLGECQFKETEESSITWRITWIEGKQLTIAYSIAGGSWITHRFWDVWQYYTTSLDKAAKKYLGEAKIEVETKTFTPAYIETNWDTIVSYCKKDALLAQRLGERLLDECESWHVPPNSLLSTASLSERFFELKSEPYYMGRDFEIHKEHFHAAFLSYSGGLFHVYKKGFGHYYQYDINSAYPWAMRQLKDLRRARYVTKAARNPHADFSFLLCTIHIKDDLRHPVAVQRKGINLYPAGKIRRVITGPEYDFLVLHGSRVKIEKGWHIYCHTEAPYLYRDAIDYLYAKKAELKGSDNQVSYQLCKILMNSFYGKAMQLIEQILDEIKEQVLTGSLPPEEIPPEAKYWKAGRLWCPVYASYITAMVRVMLCELAQKNIDVVAAAATDSLITTAPIELTLGKSLGEWSLEVEGEGVIIGSGVYDVSGKSKFRGIHTDKKLLKMIREQIDKPAEDTEPDKLRIEFQRPWTWQEVVFRGMGKDSINLFHTEVKEIDINFERRRLWQYRWKSLQDILAGGIVDSYPIPWQHEDMRQMPEENNVPW